ncbi:MAG: alginate export family protein [Halioglobus sp.]
MKPITMSCYILPLLLSAAAAVQAEEGVTDSLTGMVTDGKASLDLRYRYENVDQDSLRRTASANTLRSRLTLASASLSGVSALAEVDNVSDFGSDNYNSTENGNTQYPVIADPTGTDLNQVWLKYTGEKADGTLGRQRINHGNQRFVGGVGWRQNEQTYDAFRANWKPISILNLDFSYVNNVQRIFGPDDGANPAALEGDNFFFRADYKLNPGNTITAFGYWLDIDEDGPYGPAKTVNNSSDTYGVEYNGRFDWFTAAASYATQSEAGDSELNYDADYYKVELGADVSVVTLKAGYEVLASDNNVGFATPLATLHKFQGWADIFLSTPGDGVEDLYGSVGTKLGSVTLVAVYHDFQAEDSSEDFGKEIDLAASWVLTKRLTMQAKVASFDSDSDRYSDTDKVWFTAQYKL